MLMESRHAFNRKFPRLVYIEESFVKEWIVRVYNFILFLQIDR
jgi:hypothetical protein